MHQLSINAKAKREADMKEVVGRADIFQFIGLILIGLLYATVAMTRNLTPKQRGVLSAVVIMVGGICIVAIMQTQFWMFSLLIMFGLGVAVNEISKL